ncbi:hypothetical protein [Hyphomicrobium sp. CS1GBMeth3]|uniref:hypothetical protein n=1 Tax=Hyphomicrobium sp. CS1GBMeth3 TaxID=1892845 RepID=UPI000930CB83|nr:hypothetical protein [Hyphomicrobium sp. CS1GBMeth3]
MASLIAREGIYYGRYIYYVGPKGARRRKEKRKSLQISNPSEARRRLVAWEDELEATKWGECSKLRFEEAALPRQSRKDAATSARYQAHLRRLKPHFDGKLKSVTGSHA